MSDKPWPFVRWSPHPSIPKVDVAPLPVPSSDPDRCWLCLGRGEMLDDAREPITCDCCNGTGKAGRW